KAILETDVYRLRRGLCLPSASAAAVNLVLGQRLIGDDDSDLRIADFFSTLLPYHGQFKSEQLPRGWLVVTSSGDMYHHAIAAFVRGLDL
ncbi:hypothetical protein MEO41_29090, partial [Dolichospermum sp. ST_sed4]|nr:hypothetical protein [Dolichospermum sp. ST_sed4]